MHRHILLLIFFITSLHAGAYHIAGGDLTTRWIGGNNFEVRLTLFRDCANQQAAPFDAMLTLGIFNMADHSLVDTVQMSLFSIESMSLTGASCVTPPEVCMERGEYIDTFQVAANSAGYYLAWERCCRNSTVININNPDATAMTFYHEMADPALNNSSPVFNASPSPYICAGQLFRFNFLATDSEGDSLVYSFSDPLDGGHTSQFSPHPFNPLGDNLLPEPAPYTPISWGGGIDLSNITGSATPMTINTQTGEIEGIPDAMGIYAMAVTVMEYRNGIHIGTVRREIEFTVIACTDNNAPSVSAPVFQGTSAVIYASDTLCVPVTAKDIDGDSLFLIHYGEIFAGDPSLSIFPPFAVSSDTTGADSVVTELCWITECHHGRDSAYVATYEVRDNGCPLPITTLTKFRITVLPVPEIQKQNLLCMQLVSSDELRIYLAPDTAIIPRYFSYFTLYRSVNGGPYLPYKIINDPLLVQVTDSLASANTINDYCYYITGTNNCGEEGPASDTLCSITVINDKKNYIETVSVENKNKIYLRWENFPDGYYSVYHIYRRINDAVSTPEKVDEIRNYTGNTWEDPDVNTSDHSYCYTIINEDICGNLSPVSDEACTIFLKGDVMLFHNKLDWTSYINWRGNVGRYLVERADIENNIPYSDVTLQYLTDTSALDYNIPLNGGIMLYRIRAIEGQGGSGAESLSNEAELIHPPVAYIPNAFSPNADGKNEGWGAHTAFVESMDLQLFNRWGQLIFTAKNPSDKWDGKYNGDEVPQGVYFYKVEFKGFNERDRIEKTGSVTVIR